ncbi:MAG: M28 family peptidase, partial [Bacilli bacterium]
MKKIISIILFCLMIVGCENKSDLSTDQESYLTNLTPQYAYEVALSLEQFKTNEKLGYRNAGSNAEIAASKMLQDEMIKIGLTDVKREEIMVDSFSFEHATLSYVSNNNQVSVELGSYPTHFITNGPQEYTIVDGKKGSASDLKDLDIKGKIVLLSINQREDWWLNWPVYEASLKEVAGVILYQDGGYGEASDEALNAQDMIGPASTPALSISKKDALNLLKVMDNKEYKITLDVSSTIKKDAQAYNVSGKIIGKNPDEQIIISSHYDVYFDGFQDNNMAVGLSLGIAKGLIDAQIKPDKTIIFISHAAEEWGIIDSHYDWSTGAYNQVNKVQPNWHKNTFVDINFELPAYEHSTSDGIASVYEYTTFLNNFKGKVPQVKGVYPKGIEVISGLRTWSDDYAYSLNGIPSLRNEFMDSKFSSNYYHTQFDNKDTYNDKALLHHLQLYGLLTLEYDQQLLLPFDFSTRLEEYVKRSGIKNDE